MRKISRFLNVLLIKFNHRFYPLIYTDDQKEPAQESHASQEYQAFVYKDLDLIKRKQSMIRFATRYLEQNETLFQDLKNLERFEKLLKDISPIPRHPSTPQGSDPSIPEIEYVIEIDFKESI